MFRSHGLFDIEHKIFKQTHPMVLLPEVFQPAGNSIFSSNPLRKLFSLSRENPSTSYKVLPQKNVSSKDRQARWQHCQRWGRRREETENYVTGAHGGGHNPSNDTGKEALPNRDSGSGDKQRPIPANIM